MIRPMIGYFGTLTGIALGGFKAMERFVPKSNLTLMQDDKKHKHKHNSPAHKGESGFNIRRTK